MKYSFRIHDVGDGGTRPVPPQLDGYHSSGEPTKQQAPPHQTTESIVSATLMTASTGLIDWLDGRRNNVVVRIVQVPLRDGVKACLVEP